LRHQLSRWPKRYIYPSHNHIVHQLRTAANQNDGCFTHRLDSPNIRVTLARSSSSSSNSSRLSVSGVKLGLGSLEIVMTYMGDAGSVLNSGRDFIDRVDGTCLCGVRPGDD